MSDCALKGAATKGRPPPSPERGRGPTVLCLPCCAWNFFPSEVTFASNSQREEEERGGPSTPFTSLLALEGRGEREKGRSDRATGRPTAATMKRVLLGRFPSSVLFMPPTGGRTRTEADCGGGEAIDCCQRKWGRQSDMTQGTTIEADDGRRALLNDHPRTK